MLLDIKLPLFKGFFLYCKGDPIPSSGIRDISFYSSILFSSILILLLTGLI